MTYAPNEDELRAAYEEQERLRARVAELEVEREQLRDRLANARETNYDLVMQACAERDESRARVAELERENAVLGADCHDGACRACVKCCDAALARAEAAEARVAELEEGNVRRQVRAEAQVATLRALARLVIEQTGEDENGDMPDHPRGALLTLRKAALAATEPRGGTT